METIGGCTLTVKGGVAKRPVGLASLWRSLSQVVFGLLAVGLVVQTRALAEDRALSQTNTANREATSAGVVNASAELIMRALSLLGRPYRFGGAEPNGGFDCSGLVKFVYDDVLNVSLPRRADQMSKLGQPIDRASLQPGDLLFYNTLAKPFSHVAIYLGGGNQVHAPARGGVVSIEAIDDPYWRSRFNAARRIDDRTLTAMGGGTGPRAVLTAPQVMGSSASAPKAPGFDTVGPPILQPTVATNSNVEEWPDEWSRGP